MEGSSASCLVKKDYSVGHMTGAINDQVDFDQMSAKLKERFPFKKRKVGHIGTFRQVMALKQGDKSFEDYAEEAIRLKSLVGPDMEALLCEQWANGLQNEAISASIAVKYSGWKAKDDAAQKTNINRTIDLAGIFGVAFTSNICCTR